MGMLGELFAWWGGNTWGTRLTLWRQAQFVGEDEFGNRYYEQARGVGPHGKPRRWVTYQKLSEASQVPADWHGWLHHTHDVAPSEAALVTREWHQPHLMNMTGTSQAYRPPGSILTPETRPKATGDYAAWTPES